MLYSSDDHPQAPLAPPLKFVRRVFHDDGTVTRYIDTTRGDRILDRVANDERVSFLDRCFASPVIWAFACGLIWIAVAFIAVAVL